MAGLVDSLVDELVNAYENEQDLVKESDVRFSVNISAADNRRLKYCLNRVGRSRAGFASDAIVVVLTELEKRLGLIEEKEEGRFEWNDWYHDNIVMPPTEEEFRKEFGFKVNYVEKEGALPVE